MRVNRNKDPFAGSRRLSLVGPERSPWRRHRGDPGGADVHVEAVGEGRRRPWIIAAIAALAVGGTLTGVALSSGTARPEPAATDTSGSDLLYATLEGVTCVSAKHCLAVGDFLPTDKDADVGDPDGDGQATHTLVEVSDGRSWRRVPSPDAGEGGSILTSIACPAANDCTAVGSYKRSVFGAQMSKAPPAYPLIEHYDGRAWALVDAPTIAPNTTLASVSCPSSTYCVAVGADAVGLATGGANAVPVIEENNGSSWRVVPVTLQAGMSAELTSVACPSQSFCVAVGGLAPRSDPTSTRPLIEAWSAGSWHSVSLPPGSDGPGILNDVTCPSPGHCVAVGTTGVLRASGAGLAIDLDGATWTTDTSSLEVGGDATFSAIGCSSIEDCVVVGTSAAGLASTPARVAARIERGTWEPLSAVEAGEVVAIACPAATACVGVGTRPVNDFGNTTVFITGLDASGWRPLLVRSP